MIKLAWGNIKVKKRFGNISLLSEQWSKISDKLSCSLLIFINLQDLAVGKETSF